MAFWASFFKYLASIFAFAALLLQFFTLLGNTYNVRFLRDMYFARLTKNSHDFIDFGLWGACYGSNNTITYCNTPKPAFDWSKADGLDEFVSTLSLEGHYSKVFLAEFILYWCGFALTLFAFIFSVSTHYNRVTDSLAALATSVAFLVLAALFVMLIVVAYRVIHTAISSFDNGLIHGSIGSATWMTLGAMAGLLFATIYYCLGCLFRARRKVNYDKI
ncbi:MAG: actin cortical patch SUR7/pH-response regulator pali [Benjaminiella poitrasii]|nr:MAG: actin cortical patch SUR7/pH-response regulator pali [Benjaminiella poitrasii]